MHKFCALSFSVKFLCEEHFLWMPAFGSSIWLFFVCIVQQPIQVLVPYSIMWPNLPENLGNFQPLVIPVSEIHVEVDLKASWKQQLRAQKHKHNLGVTIFRQRKIWTNFIKFIQVLRIFIARRVHLTTDEYVLWGRDACVSCLQHTKYQRTNCTHHPVIVTNLLSLQK